MKKLVAAALVMAFTSPAFASDSECTPESVQTKALEIGTAIQTIAAQNPARMQEITTEMQEKATAAQTSGDIEGLCAFYDSIIEEAAK